MRKFPLRALLLITAVPACASTSPLFTLGRRPREIAGTWIDVAQTSATEEVAWVLSPDGNDHTRRVVVRDSSHRPLRTVRESWNGWWYVSGNLSDSKHRAICYKRRPRDGPTCLRFRLDTLDTRGTRRRLTVFGYPNADWPQPRIFISPDH